MDRRAFSTSLAAGVAGSLLGVSNQAQAAVSARHIVFVHGLFADGSCWSEVIDRLQPLGFRVTSVQNPLRSFEDDVATARRAGCRRACKRLMTVNANIAARAAHVLHRA